jgi:hypothetical protein
VDEIGPVAWRNWRAAHQVPPVRSGVEVLLYSDAHVTGEVAAGLGPYQLLNALPGAGARGAQPAVVIRAGYAIEFRPNLQGKEDVTDETRYHGGDMFDEIAALLSLALGIRCRSAGRIRIWELGEGNDPLGHPVHFDVDPPYLPEGDARIPRLRRTVAVGDADPFLQRYAAVRANDAVSLLRAARLYQQAVWIADTDPSQSWVQLVSALETAASATRVKGPSPLDRLRAAWPQLAKLLDDLADDVGADAIARLVAPVVKSKAEYLRFMDAFAPAPPAERPYEWARVDWPRLPEHLATIYDYRSRALHAGTPFPVPMCEPARVLDDGVPIERPMGMSTWAQDARWNADDTAHASVGV